MVDTCQAGSLSNAIVSPNVVTIGSSKPGESSYAHHSDREVGLAVIDRFTFATLDYLQRMKVGDAIRSGFLRDLFSFYDPDMLYSTPDYRTDMLGRPIEQVPITDFLGSILDVQLHYDDEAYPIEGIVDSDEAAADAAQPPGQSPLSNDSAASQQKTTVSPRGFQFSLDFFIALAVFIIASAIVTTKKL
jgi:glycosylphosphatidylinositol transamidase (GPIT) subunit GPI8